MKPARDTRDAHTGLLAAAQIWSKLFRHCGLDAQRIWAESGSPGFDNRDPNARAPLKHLDAALELAAARIEDPAWALKIARCWHPGNLGVLGHAWLASSTLRSSLIRLERYWRIVTTRAEIRLVPAGRDLRFIYSVPGAAPLVRSVLADAVLSLVLDMCRANIGERIHPLGATLRRPAPADNSPWIDCFGCPVVFDHAENSITFTAADADRALSSANRMLAGVLDRLLVEALAALDRGDIESRCKAAVLTELSSGEPRASTIAGMLHMSSRTLQRRLATARTSYQQLVDETRRDLALRYIRDPAKSATEITFLLGFSGQSAFSRAFRRWTGQTPTDFRKAMR